MKPQHHATAGSCGPAPVSEGTRQLRERAGGEWSKSRGLGICRPLVVLVPALALLGLAPGCETTGGSSDPNSIYYGVGFHDPWYYGGYHDDPDIVVTPPAGRPTHPIARPPAGPRPTPMPVMPPPRPMPRAR